LEMIFGVSVGNPRRNTIGRDRLQDTGSGTPLKNYSWDDGRTGTEMAGKCILTERKSKDRNEENTSGQLCTVSSWTRIQDEAKGRPSKKS